MRLVTSLVAVTLSFATAVAGQQCGDSLFPGFDSRLDVVPSAHFELGLAPVVGFEQSAGRLLVAQPHKITTAYGEKTVSIPVLDSVEGVSVDAARALRVQTRRGIFKVSATGLIPDRALSDVGAGRLANSGGDLFMEGASTNGSVTFTARRPDGAGLPIIELDGEAGPFSWSSLGLAAVVEDSVVTWEAGGSEFLALATDPAFRAARDVCLVGGRRVVVGLENVVVLIAPEGYSVVVGFQARCAFNDDVLHLLDERSGLAWSVRNLDDLGDPEADRRHAKRLVKELPRQAALDSWQAREAARIVGCRQVRKWRG